MIQTTAGVFINNKLHHIYIVIDNIKYNIKQNDSHVVLVVRRVDHQVDEVTNPDDEVSNLVQYSVFCAANFVCL